MQRSTTWVALAAAIAATSVVVAGELPPSGELSCRGTAMGECNYRDASSDLLLQWPTDWPVRRLKLVTETGPVARSRHRDATRWVSVEYLPDDPALPEVPLFYVAVLRLADWVAQSMHAPVPAGVEVATGRDHVAVVSLQPANPFPPGSRDADIYDALRPGPAEISLIVRFPPP